MDVFEAAARARREGRPCALATVIASGGSTPRASGARMLVYEDGSQVGTIGGGNLEHQVTEVAMTCLRTGHATRFEAHLVQDLGMCCGGRVEVYVEPLEVAEPFVVFGAGHVALSLVPLLRDLGFAVTVVDDRDELITGERFPGVVLRHEDPRAFARDLPPDPRRFVLIVSHDHRLDQDLGEVLIPRDCAWIGMIGSRAKISRFLVRYRAAGMPEHLFQRLCAPVGLDLGAETPAEIAVSIAAEVIRIRRRVARAAQPLSEIPLPARGARPALAPAMERDQQGPALRVESPSKPG